MNGPTTRARWTSDELRAALSEVVDPEIPVVTIEELGVLRDVTVVADHVSVTITPTYSGCPAMDLIKDEIRDALARYGVDDVEIQMVFAPAWTTDWITPEAREKLRAFGIAPPHPADAAERPPVVCPRCASTTTSTVSEFGSTACKALMVCDRCGEPFDYFKEL